MLVIMGNSQVQCLNQLKVLEISFFVDTIPLKIPLPVQIVYFRLNDIVATGNNTFYATNDDVFVSFQGNWKWIIEPFLQTPFGNIVYYDGQSARTVAGGYVLANGINLAPDQKTLYLANYGEANMVVFKRHPDNSLTEIKRVDLHMPRPDNIEVDFDGNLWIAGGYKLLADANSKAPSSMVIRGKPENDDFTFREVFVDDGQILDSACVVSFFQNQMLVGTPYQRLLYCDDVNVN
ncbi:serum paraoxonase/arylesterase 2-like isoform X1 [Amphiura filiformis]|uniref:serum paraoxonase/arylesterase 2-like isoform X1 n=2 Tax=Amphiura filiformis TaxID=82378 RepID=UPI003B211A41